MARSPNTEQALAIHKKNGVLLSAGAGSGKTFVIIEHIIYLLAEHKSKRNQIGFEEILVSEMSKIVLMTFTKKAAGEMLVRLINRVEVAVEEDKANASFWTLVLKNIYALQISTIHGFCHRLISQGFWSDLPTQIDLHSSFMQKNKIKSLCFSWVEANKNNLSDLFLSHLTDLYKAMDEIFSSPDLRIFWEKGQNVNSQENEIDAFWLQYLELANFEILFKGIDHIQSDNEKLKKTGFQLLENYKKLFLKVGVISFQNLQDYYELFESFNSFPRATKDMSDLELLTRNELKVFYDYLKKIKNDIWGLIENYDDFIVWEKKLFELFNYVNLNYMSLPGFSFSDLEYYVYKGLQDENTCQKIAERYQYFIVDEFQDTSFVQFEIVKRCVLNKTERLFCVGDKKQAIYGFRGGELAVFEECSKLLGADSNLFLRYNYRSFANVINFNNLFFKEVLPVGKDYVGHDKHSVEMVPQVVPDGKKIGEVNQFNINVSFDQSTDIDVDILEAKGLFTAVVRDLADAEIESIAILYRKLKPSHYLIDLLRENQLNFSAQIKIKFDQDPVVNLFTHFIRYLQNTGDLKKQDNSLFFIKSILQIMGFSGEVEFFLKKFLLNVPLVGVAASFWMTLIEIGISNSHYNENAKQINEICKMGQNDLLAILKILNEEESDYSFEMITGTNKKIFIQSTHASKGLEYDSVYLGGIHKNGRYEGLKKKVGSMPKSFKWKTRFDQKEYFKSMNYLIESEVNSKKDFSESKRLFYVAATRAVKKLSWINVLVNSEEQSLYGNSWINALRAFPVGEINLVNLDIELNQKTRREISYLQKDSLGITFAENEKAIGLISELSVTRLATLAECPFKFYLKNICKIEVDSENISFSDEEIEFYSSKERGSDLHFTLSKCIETDFKYEIKKADYLQICKWVQNELADKNTYKKISEKEIKFSFFGQMITAIPDLVLIAEDHVEVWDFKTGLRDEEDEAGYFFQLSAYALGLSKVYQFSQDIKMTLKLLYVDEKNIVSNQLKLKEIEENLFSVWLKTESLSQINVKHCKKCEYTKMCKFSSSVATI